MRMKKGNEAEEVENEGEEEKVREKTEIVRKKRKKRGEKEANEV